MCIQRQAEQQIPDDNEGDENKEGSSSSSPGVLSPAAKRPALPSGSTFMFRPSPLQQATQGFVLRQSTLKSPVSTFGEDICSIWAYVDGFWNDSFITCMCVQKSISVFKIWVVDPCSATSLKFYNHSSHWNLWEGPLRYVQTILRCVQRMMCLCVQRDHHTFIYRLYTVTWLCMHVYVCMCMRVRND